MGEEWCKCKFERNGVTFHELLKEKTNFNRKWFKINVRADFEFFIAF